MMNDSKTNLKEEICTLKNFKKATKKCKKGVGWKKSVILYSHYQLLNNYRVLKSIKDDKYNPIEGHKFTIYEPKKREIISTRFKDRVPQRVLSDGYLNGHLSKFFIHENCACQKGKGTDFARNILTQNMRAIFKECGLKAWVLKIDIKSYFASIDHDVAKSIMRSMIDDDWAYGMVEKIIDSHNQKVGISLGSNINQYIALCVLHQIDTFVAENGADFKYVRYADDIIVLSGDKGLLKQLKLSAVDKLKEIKLQASKKKTYISPISQPIHFLGFSYWLRPGGRITKKVLANKVTRRRRKLKGQLRRVKNGFISLDTFQQMYKGGRDHYKKGSRSALFKMDNYFKNLISEDLEMQKEIIELRKQLEELTAVVKAQEAEIALLKMEVEHNGNSN